MKTREEMIYGLTEHELEYLFDMNGDFEESVRFFAKGGFYAYTDEALLKQWTFQFTDTNTWSDTIAEWDGEDWNFFHVPLDACPEWHGQTCMSPRDLGYDGECTPEQAIAALKDWLTKP